MYQRAEAKFQSDVPKSVNCHSFILLEVGRTVKEEKILEIQHLNYSDQTCKYKKHSRRKNNHSRYKSSYMYIVISKTQNHENRKNTIPCANLFLTSLIIN